VATSKNARIPPFLGKFENRKWKKISRKIWRNSEEEKRKILKKNRWNLKRKMPPSTGEHFDLLQYVPWECRQSSVPRFASFREAAIWLALPLAWRAPSCGQIRGIHETDLRWRKNRHVHAPKIIFFEILIFWKFNFLKFWNFNFSENLFFLEFSFFENKFFFNLIFEN